ncbi:MAG: SGNH/GDSL hydrolase family protein, partial [Planctomycetaceae bacterium]|nr:SGNH/GDSL hydrolase family protein [Planctomycetaceae bacterium]
MPSTESPRPPARRWMFRAIAVGVGVLPLIAVELVLSILGLGEPGTAADPLAGFSGVHRLFERDSGTDEYRTSPSRGLFFGEQRFAVSKPDDGFRMFCLGGSTVRGRPFTTETSFTRWLELELAGRIPGRTFESVNCGGLSYASYRLLPILQEVLTYDPDLVVVATGHNEFLEDRSYKDIKSRSAVSAWIEDRALSLRTVTLVRSAFQETDRKQENKPSEPSEVEARLDEQSGYASYHRDDAWRKRVVAQYEDSLRKMVVTCRAAEVPLVLVRLGSNLRDCPPFKSEHRDGLSPEGEAAWQRAFDDGAEAERQGMFSAALVSYHDAEEHDDQFALLFWRMARVLDRLGRFDEARAAYRRARDLDICPLRMVSELDECLVLVAQETKTPLVDAAAASEAASRERIPGYDWFMDHVHPTIFGHQQIAGLIAEKLDGEGLLPESSGNVGPGPKIATTDDPAAVPASQRAQLRTRMRRR